jgi:hypothetical protein
MRSGVVAWWAEPVVGINELDGVGHDNIGENGISGVGGRSPVGTRATVGAADAAPGAATLAGGGTTAPPPPESE